MALLMALGYYPDYWDPWRPCYWDFYYGYHSSWNHHYYIYYNHCDHPRYHRYNDFYFNGICQDSPQVNHKIAEGSYKETYSRPELWGEGAELYNRTQTSGSNDSHRTSAATGTRGAAAPATVQNTETRRKPAEASSSGRSDATVTSRRDTPSSVTAKNTAVENRSEDRRAAESRAAESRESERRAAESKAAEARRSESNTTSESRINKPNRRQ
jgi:hypothetical protein